MVTRRLVKMRGSVACETVRRGTASEHHGLVLTTGKGNRLLLVRLAANPFEDRGPEGIAGAQVEAEGYVVGNELRYRTIRRI